MMVLEPKFVDFHCHVDLYPDFEELLTRCESDQTYTLAVTTTPKAWPRNRDLTANCKFVRAALGLHPQLVAERAMELALWEEYLPEAKYVGEIGLDSGPQYVGSLGLQKDIFESVLKACSRAGEKILSVHSVRSTKLVLDMVEKHISAGRSKIVLHWFTGTKSEARRAYELGCYFSINAEMLRNERHRGLIKSLSTDRLLTETDGPFTKIEGRPTRPSDIPRVVDSLAGVLDKDREATKAAIYNNLLGLLSFR